MALSDACFEFRRAVTRAVEASGLSLERYASAPGGGRPDDPGLRRAVASAVDALGRAAEHYATSPLGYGAEIEGLRRAVAAVRADGPGAFARLLALAAAVQAHYDTPPGVPELAQREAAMKALVAAALDARPE